MLLPRAAVLRICLCPRNCLCAARCAAGCLEELLIRSGKLLPAVGLSLTGLPGRVSDLGDGACDLCPQPAREQGLPHSQACLEMADLDVPPWSERLELLTGWCLHLVVVEGGVRLQGEQVQAGDLVSHPFSKKVKLMLASVSS